MPTPEFVLALREKVGSAPLWLSGSTGVILRERAGRRQVLLIRRSDNGRWTPVSGIVDPGEDPHVTIVREAMEEAGVVCEIDRLAWLHVTDTVVYPNGDQTQYIDHTFACRWVSGEPRADEDEATAAAFFDLDGLPEVSAEHRRALEICLADDPRTVLGDA